MGDVSVGKAGTAWKIALDPELTKGKRGGVAYLSARVRREIRSFLSWRRRTGEPMEAGSPLFLSRHGRRVSLRRIQFMFREWQEAAGFESVYPFHALRHSAITNVYRATKDLYLTQRFARHSSRLTTTAYTHPTDEELYEEIRRLRA